MATATQLRAGWKIMPDRRTVTFKKRTSTVPAYTSYNIGNAWDRPDNTEEGAPSYGVYIKRFRRWYIVKEIAVAAGLTTEPLPGDVVTSGTTTIDPVAADWTVLSQTEAGALGAWQLSCVKLEVRSALAVSVTVKRLTGAQDNTSRMLPTTTTVTTANGWLQDDGAGTVPDLLMKMQMPTSAILYLPTTIEPILGTDVITVGGTDYNIDEMNFPNRFDELQTLNVRLAR